MFSASCYAQTAMPQSDAVAVSDSYCYTPVDSLTQNNTHHNTHTYGYRLPSAPSFADAAPFDQSAYLPLKHDSYDDNPASTASLNDLACYQLSSTGHDFTDVNLLEPSIGAAYRQQPPPQPVQHSTPTRMMPPPQQQQLMQHQPQQQQQLLNTAHHQQLFQPPPYNNSPTGSSYTSSNGSDDSDDIFCWHPYKRSPSFPVMEPVISAEFAKVDASNDCRKRGKVAKKRKPKKDPNEPHKPVSAYALFFRDTQAAIKGQNPNATFGEVSKIVASMWDGLECAAKAAYKLKTETAKKDYLKQLAAYRANQLSKYGGGNPTGLLDMGSANAAHKSMFPADSTTSLVGRHPSVVDSAASVSSAQTMMTSSSADTASLAGKSLASLIAEPPPQRVLTATTTLTVPQAYILQCRNKVDYDDQSRQQQAPFMDSVGGSGAGAGGSVWDREFRPSQDLMQHCKDVFNVWSPTTPNTTGSVSLSGRSGGQYAP